MKQNHKVRYSQQSDKCVNCGSERFTIAAKGLCSRCYPLQRRIAVLEKWDGSVANAPRQYSTARTLVRAEELPVVKHALIRQIQERLWFLKQKEEQLQGPIDAIDIEYQLDRLACLAGARNTNNNSLFFGNAGFIAVKLDAAARKTIFYLLNCIEENIPWDGIDYDRIVREMHRPPENGGQN